MRVTIICGEGKVIVDGIAIEGIDLSFMDPTIRVVQWRDTNGWVEFYPVDDVYSTNLKITDFSPFQAAVDAWQVIYDVETAPAPEPTYEEKLAAQQQQAKQLLADSDWAVLPDVGLANQDAWVAYRAALRPLATTETTLVDSFPTQPEVIWG